MTDGQRSREDIEALAATVGGTPHPALDDETIDAVLAFVSELQARLEGEVDHEGVRDLLAFWDGYVKGGVADTVDDVETFVESTTLRERFRRGNDADLFGLDVYQALMKLEDAYDEGRQTVASHTADWARHVAELTADVAEHLEDHRS